MSGKDEDREQDRERNMAQRNSGAGLRALEEGAKTILREHIDNRIGDPFREFVMPTRLWIVVKFWGNKDIFGGQTLDSVWFTRDAAEKRASRMQTRHNWIWKAVPADADIRGVAERARKELQARGLDV